jgi:hypothetical protein
MVFHKKFIFQPSASKVAEQPKHTVARTQPTNGCKPWKGAMDVCGLKHILRITCFHYVPSGTFTGAGLNLSYRVLHPSGIGFVLEFGSHFET